MASIQLSLILPPGFGPIPLNHDPLERERSARRLLDFLPDDAVVDRRGAVAGLVTVSGALLADGAVIAGQLTLPDASSSISAMLVVSVHRPTGDGWRFSGGRQLRDDTENITTAIKERNPGVAVGVREFPCGPAVVMLRAGEYRLPGRITRSGEPTGVSTNEIRVLIPGSEPDQIVVAEISSSHDGQFPRFAEIFFNVIETMRFRSTVGEEI